MFFSAFFQSTNVSLYTDYAVTKKCSAKNAILHITQLHEISILLDSICVNACMYIMNKKTFVWFFIYIFTKQNVLLQKREFRRDWVQIECKLSHVDGKIFPYVTQHTSIFSFRSVEEIEPLNFPDISGKHPHHCKKSKDYMPPKSGAERVSKCDVSLDEWISHVF